MSTSFLFALLLSALALTASAQGCGRKCKFRFCKADGEDPPNLRQKGARILIRGPDSSRTGYICRSFPGGKTLGVIKSTGTAIVNKNGVTRPINRWRPAGLSPRFPRNYFQLYNILFLQGLQGPGRRASRGNQEDFLDDICVVLPITAYDILNTDGSIARSISSTKAKDCISFRTRNPAILVEVAWNSSDDFDLFVEGPPGSDGERINDNNIGNCGVPPAGKEAVVYDDFMAGDYKIRLFHFNNCFNKVTKWRVNVIVNGVRIFQRNGRSSVDGRNVLEVTVPIA